MIQNYSQRKCTYRYQKQLFLGNGGWSKYEIGNQKARFIYYNFAIARKLVFTKWQEALGR